jgi:hypothetical protein
MNGLMGYDGRGGGTAPGWGLGQGIAPSTGQPQQIADFAHNQAEIDVVCNCFTGQ